MNNAHPITVQELQDFAHAVRADSLKAFLSAYHQELTASCDFPPLKINKALHRAAAVLGYRNGETLMAALGNAENTSSDEQAGSMYDIQYLNRPPFWTIRISDAEVAHEIAHTIFTEQVYPYTVVEREEQIRDLIDWISESNDSASAMREDMEYLMGLKDEYVFSSTETNDFVAQSDNPERFDEICRELIDLNNEFKGDYAVYLSTDSFRDINDGSPRTTPMNVSNAARKAFGVSVGKEVAGNYNGKPESFGYLQADEDGDLFVNCHDLEHAKQLIELLTARVLTHRDGEEVYPTFDIITEDGILDDEDEEVESIDIGNHNSVQVGDFVVLDGDEEDYDGHHLWKVEGFEGRTLILSNGIYDHFTAAASDVKDVLLESEAYPIRNGEATVDDWRNRTGVFARG